MCHQRVFVHEHCDCVWEKYSSLCEEHNTPGHTIEDWPVLVDKPCDVHPGGTPLSIAYFLRAAEFASLEDDDSCTDDTTSSSNAQSDGTNESDDEPQVDVQEEQKRDPSATYDNSDHSFADENIHQHHDGTSTPNQRLPVDSSYDSIATDGKPRLAPSLRHPGHDGEKKKKTTEFIANAIKAPNAEDTVPIDLGQSIESVYQSLPLAADEIRVIKLQPAPSLLAPLIAELTILKLGGDASRYDALSYRWGDCLDPVNVTMNGICMTVTQSLDTALRYLRHSEEERVVWADSVCINQEDMKEKSTQIQKMDEIYREASCVRIWLGEAEGSTEAAMVLLNDCATLNNETKATQRILEDDAGMRGLTELLLRPYWSRMWVFQEILLASRAEVHCGTFSADWWTIKTLDILTSNPAHWTVPQTRVALVGNMRKAFMNIAHFNIPSSQPKSIENLLFPTSHLQASNDRDKLYALMGLCNIGAYLTVDYSKATQDIYMDFTRCYARRTGDLSLLYGAGLCQSESTRGENIGLASWIPDFRGTDGRDSFLLSAGLSKAFDASAGKRYTERRQNESEMDLRDDGLLVEALVVEEVVMTQSIDVSNSGRRAMYLTVGIGREGRCSFRFPAMRALAEALFLDRDADSFHPSPKGDSQDMNVSLFRLLGLLRDSEIQYNSESSDPAREPGLSAFLEWSGLKQAGQLSETYTRLWSSEPKMLDYCCKIFIRELNRMRSASSKLFSTNSGYIGRTSAMVAEGDMVAILPGSRLPCVLRKSLNESSYQIVSPCYVSGMMFGELLGGSGVDQDDIQEFKNIMLV